MISCSSCCTTRGFEVVYQPTYAAYLNLIEPWWKGLQSLALKGPRFQNWQEVVTVVEAGTAYCNAHKHPFVWGRRRRHQPRRLPPHSPFARSLKKTGTERMNQQRRQSRQKNPGEEHGKKKETDF
jgi:hypothetical protein